MFWLLYDIMWIIYRLSQARSHVSTTCPGLSDSEPSALTTGLLDKAAALAYPRYSWPRMLKVAPCTVIRSYGRTVVHPNFFGKWVTTVLYNYGAMLCELCYKLSQNISDYLWVHAVTVFNQHYHSNQNVCINFKKDLLYTSPGGESNPGFPRDRRRHSPPYYRGAPLPHWVKTTTVKKTILQSHAAQKRSMWKNPTSTIQ